MADSSIPICPSPIPDDKELSEAYEIYLQTKAGESVRFGELVAGRGDHITTIVIFIRHFFCIYDQDYVHAMSQRITDSVLSTLSAPVGPSQLIIIGCGKPSRIVPYTSETEAAFPIYTDPSGKIYDKLQMKKTFACISRPPSYTQISFFRGLLKSLKQMARSGIQAIKGGSWRQNGGEWIFRDGRCVYVHRMENVSDHLTAEQLLDLLKTDDKQAG